MLHMVGGELYLTISALLTWDRQCVEDSEQKNDSINESMSDEGVYRTAPATPVCWTVESPQGLCEIFAHGSFLGSSDFMMTDGNSLVQIFPDNPYGLSTVCTSVHYLQVKVHAIRRQLPGYKTLNFNTRCPLCIARINCQNTLPVMLNSTTTGVLLLRWSLQDWSVNSSSSELGFYCTFS